MLKPILFVSAAALAANVTAGSTPAQAQGFGRILERAIGRTIERRVDEATQLTQERRPPAPAQAAADDRPSRAISAPAVTLPAPPGVEPWPINAGHRAVTRPSQFVFAPDMVALKQRFLAASTFPCSTCEGSQDFDTWRRFIRPERDTYSAWGTLLEGWTVGRTIQWRGTAHDGQVNVVSEVPVGGFQCRQLRHRVTSRGRNPATTERPGLICLGKRDAYSGSETWHEVF